MISTVKNRDFEFYGGMNRKLRQSTDYGNLLFTRKSVICTTLVVIVYLLQRVRIGLCITGTRTQRSERRLQCRIVFGRSIHVRVQIAAVACHIVQLTCRLRSIGAATRERSWHSANSKRARFLILQSGVSLACPGCKRRLISQLSGCRVQCGAMHCLPWYTHTLLLRWHTQLEQAWCLHKYYSCCAATVLQVMCLHCTAGVVLALYYKLGAHWRQQQIVLSVQHLAA